MNHSLAGKEEDMSMNRMIVLMMVVVTGLAMAQCGGDDEQPEYYQGIMYESPGERCPQGGVIVVWGHDTNKNQYVDEEEVEKVVTYWCNVPCENEQHDGGDEKCVPAGTCSHGYHIGGYGQCLSSTVEAIRIDQIDRLCFQGFTYTDEGCVEKGNL